MQPLASFIFSSSPFRKNKSSFKLPLLACDSPYSIGFWYIYLIAGALLR